MKAFVYLVTESLSSVRILIVIMYRAVAPIHSGLVVRTFHFPLQDCEDGGKWAYYLLDTAIELIVTIIRAQFLPATRDCGVSGDVESTYFTEWAGIYFADSEAWG